MERILSMLFSGSVRRKKTIWILLLAAAFVAVSVSFAVIARSQKKIIPVPYISQRGTLESGCELISAIMVLRYYGCAVGIEDFAARVPTSQLRQTENGLVGGDPAKAFIGDPHSPSGLGCYAPVIALAMNSFLPQAGTKRAVAFDGTDFDVLLNRYVAGGTPVIVWATSNMAEPSAGPRWTVGGTGRQFQWIGGEHCLVMIGFDRQKIYFRDPYGANGAVAFDRDTVKSRYRVLGSQSIVVQ